MKRAADARSEPAEATPAAKRQAASKLGPSPTLLDHFPVTHVPRVPSPICASDPITDRRSTFVAHAAPVTTPVGAIQFQNHVRHLRADRTHPREAEHEIYAARFLSLRPGKEGTDQNDWTVKITGEDDGEKGGSNAIKKVLERTVAVDICVVVSRYYGGILLGQDRFAHIQNVAEQAITRLQQAIEIKELVKQIEALDDKIHALLKDKAPSLAPDYSNLDLARARRLVLARTKRLGVLEAKHAAPGDDQP
ncbi:hypothetical protein OIV83_004247 [Microbotryomycetes sp. JL201]|nr:hypothetical protein OIV83_004247 [Microbotryomycetes sp. JL201]